MKFVCRDYCFSHPEYYGQPIPPVVVSIHTVQAGTIRTTINISIILFSVQRKNIPDHSDEPLLLYALPLHRPQVFNMYILCC